MLKCKICEHDIHEEKLSTHSLVCKEVALLKHDLHLLRDNMEDYEERATLIKNTLETNAARQKRLQLKRNSRASVSGDMNSPTLSTKETFSGHSARIEATDGETNHSEEESGTPSTVSNRTFTPDSNSEPLKKMSCEEYTRFVEEVKKGIFALKKVISFANKIVNRAFQIGQIDDVDRITLNEMDIIYEQIVDNKVLEFIHSFKKDLEDYITKKAKYVANTKKLIQIGYDTFEENKDLLKLSKSSSYTKPVINLKPKVIPKFREDEVLGSTPGTQKPNSKSPSLKKKPAPGKAMNNDFASPFFNKSSSKKNQGFSSLAQSSLFGILPKSTATTPKLQKAELSRSLLQTNSNHIMQLSGLYSHRKDSGDSGSVKDKIKVLTNKSIIIGGGKDEQKMSSPNLSTSFGSFSNVPSPHGISPYSFSSYLMSPNVSTPNTIKRAQYKEAVLHKRSRFSTNANPLLAVKAVGAETPVSKEQGKQEQEKHSESRPQTQKKPNKRFPSLEFFKNIRLEEESAMKQFPSLLASGVASTVVSPSHCLSNAASPANVKNTPPVHKKKKSAESLVTSPSMKGYFSDTLKKSKRKTPASEMKSVSIDDFKFKKFLGKGAYGTVWLVEKKATGDFYAMKIVDSANMFTQNRMNALKAEKDIYEVLQGDFVVKAVWTFDQEDYICFVTEYMVGGDFNKIIEKLGRLENDQAQFYFAELVLAIESLHNMGIVHRDLKPDNILMDAKGHIRLTDFGLSKNGLDILRGNGGTPEKMSQKGSPGAGVDETQQAKNPKFIKNLKKMLQKEKEQNCDFKVKSSVMRKGETIFNFLENNYMLLNQKKPVIVKHSFVKEPSPNNEKKVRIIGTPDYMAPEVINPDKINKETYNERWMDLWSLGVILYEFLVGLPPFNADSREEIFENIEHLNMEWPPIGYDEDSISPEAVDLIKKLLNPDPSKRLGASGIKEIKEHAFFKSIISSGKYMIMYIDFKWEGLREREAPIIPCLQEELASMKNKDEEALKHPFSDYKEKRKASKLANSRKSVDLQAFRLNRVDVLDKMNQEHVKKVQKQKSVSGKLA